MTRIAIQGIKSIETYKQNFTRFLIFDDSIHVDKSRINKTSTRYEQALSAVKPLMTDLNILGEYEAAV
jgi:prephenate dehydratase